MTKPRRRTGDSWSREAGTVEGRAECGTTKGEHVRDLRGDDQLCASIVVVVTHTYTREEMTAHCAHCTNICFLVLILCGRNVKKAIVVATDTGKSKETESVPEPWGSVALTMPASGPRETISNFWPPEP